MSSSSSVLARGSMRPSSGSSKMSWATGAMRGAWASIEVGSTARAAASCGGAPHAAGSTTASNATQAPAMSFMRPFPLASHPHPPFRIDEATARIVDVLVEAAVLVGERRILVEQVVDAQAKVVLYAAIRVAEAEADEGIERQPAVDAEHVPVLVARSTGVVRTHTSELQSLMRISYAVFCLKKKKPTT